MGIFEKMSKQGHEQLVFAYDRSTNLRTVVAIHNTTLGPALGGTRMMAYPTEDDAIDDVLRLSRGMTYKAAASGVNYGGGKAVIWGDPGHDKSEGLWRAYGQFVQALGGRFITGTDMGTYPQDFVLAAQESDYLVGLPEEYGGSGDTSILTAVGVFEGIRACLQHVYGKDSVQGRTVAVQGVGKVGARLARDLHEHGAIVYVCDVDETRVAALAEEMPVRVVSPEEIYSVPCDVFSPCSVGGVLNDRTIPLLQARIVAGSANNQLQEERHGEMLHARGILYAPDYIINAGGMIQVAEEWGGYVKEEAERQTRLIYQRLLELFALAEREGVSPNRAADLMVEHRLRTIHAIHKTMIPRA